MFTLRDYQQLNKWQIRQAFKHHKHVMYQAGTGSGKTVTAASIIRDAYFKQNPVWFIAHREELIKQAQGTLWKMGVRAGILKAGYRYEPHLNIQCASIDTIRERLIKNENLLVIRKPRLIVIDEAHRSLAKSYMDLMALYPDAYILGLSATPIRSDGRGLGHVYGAMVQSPSVRELIEMGWLVQPRYFTGAEPNLEGIRMHNYDYARGALEARLNNAQLRGDVVEQWLRHGENRKTIVFATGVKHSKALREDFEAAGVKAIHIDGMTLNRDRMERIEHFRVDPHLKVLVNCMIVTEGFDVPEVGCVSIACPTKIISKYLQMAGRCLRPAKGKTDCIILDHGSNILRHGFVEDPIPWSLDTEGRLNDRLPREREHMQAQHQCHVCGCVFAGQIRCPECGTRLEVQPQHELISTAEELIEVTRGARGVKAADKQKVYTDAQKLNFLRQIKGYAGGDNPKGRKYKDSWVRHTYRAKFGEFPPTMSVDVMKPEAQTLAFINARNAAYHIRRNYNEQRAAD